MNTYQKEQLDALRQVQHALAHMTVKKKNRLLADFKPYLDFRGEVDRYLDIHLGGYCTQACFNSKTSACCSKDGVIIFWADVTINACTSSEERLCELASAIADPLHVEKCVFLGSKGCLWQVRPLVCAMFFCDQAQTDVIHRDANLAAQWEAYRQQAKAFRWPDKPVLFDRLEEMFMDLGCQSPLMYINSGPGLLQVKKKAGLIKNTAHSS